MDSKDIVIETQNGNILVSWGSIIAEVKMKDISIGHFGCKLLGTLPEVPQNLAIEWDRRFSLLGCKWSWKSKIDSKKNLADTLAMAIGHSQMSGAVLWDTMRKGSDYWRPGKLLLDTVEMIPPQFIISYAREDCFCPPQDLLKQFMDTDMGFGEYAEQYSQFLRADDTIKIGMATVLLNIARKQMPIFYCVDPYIPSYASKDEFCSNVSYKDRKWLTALPKEGCHRFVLVEEIVKGFLQQEIPVRVYEIEHSARIFHERISAPKKSLENLNIV